MQRSEILCMLKRVLKRVIRKSVCHVQGCTKRRPIVESRDIFTSVRRTIWSTGSTVNSLAVYQAGDCAVTVGVTRFNFTFRLQLCRYRNVAATRIHYEGLDLRWSVSVRPSSASGEGLLVVQSESGQRLVVQLALNDLWIHGSGTRYSVTPSLVRRIMDEARALGWSPNAPGAQFNAKLDTDDCLARL